MVSAIIREFVNAFIQKVKRENQDLAASLHSQAEKAVCALQTEGKTTEKEIEPFFDRAVKGKTIVIGIERKMRRFHPAWLQD